MQRWRSSVADEGLKKGNIVVSAYRRNTRKAAERLAFCNMKMTPPRGLCHALEEPGKAGSGEAREASAA